MNKKDTPKFLNGDKVKMVGCVEATFEQNKGKVWTCKGDSFRACSGDEVVFLEGYRGYFDASNLEKV